MHGFVPPPNSILVLTLSDSEGIGMHGEGGRVNIFKIRHIQGDAHKEGGLTQIEGRGTRTHNKQDKRQNLPSLLSQSLVVHCSVFKFNQ